MNLEYIVKDSDSNKTVKDILLTNLKISHRLLITLKKENCIFINNHPAFVYNEVIPKDKVTVSFDYNEDNSNIVSKDIPLYIVYEDDWYLVVNKPAGIPVHPSISHYEDSLSSGVKHYFDSIKLNKKIRPVNRIDKDTSGLVVFAKNEYIQECLINQMKSKEFYKEYIAVVEGYIDKKENVIDLPISRKENSIIERCVDENGDKSITHYKVIKELKLNNQNISVVKCSLETGRTHQIRVHFSHIGHPLLGDDLYGGNQSIIKKQALHSYKIGFIHPITNNRVEYIADLPKDLIMFIK